MLMIVTFDHVEDLFHRICLIEKGEAVLRDNGDPVALQRLQTHAGRKILHLTAPVGNAVEVIQAQSDHIQLATVMIALAQILCLRERQAPQTARVNRLLLPDGRPIVRIKHFFRRQKDKSSSPRHGVGHQQIRQTGRKTHCCLLLLIPLKVGVIGTHENRHVRAGTLEHIPDALRIVGKIISFKYLLVRQMLKTASGQKEDSVSRLIQFDDEIVDETSRSSNK